MIDRIRSKISRLWRDRRRRGVSGQADTTFVENGTHWYEPVIAGPSTFVEACQSAETIREVTRILEKLTLEPFIEFNLSYYRAGLERFGARWKHADLLTVLAAVCRLITVEAYLEIGVRRGRSMAVVGALQPAARIVGFDRWITNYVGVANPGPAFVEAELARVGHAGPLELVAGDSRRTVPEYLRAHPDHYFDLVTVDGDHSNRGSRIDLSHVIPRLKVGGILVFDDIANPYHPRLGRVWDRMVGGSERFLAAAFRETGYGVGFAVKRY